MSSRKAKAGKRTRSQPSFQYRAKQRPQQSQTNSSLVPKAARPLLIIIIAGLLCLAYLRIPSVEVSLAADQEARPEQITKIEDRAGELLSSWWGSYNLFDRQEFEQNLLGEFSQIAAVREVNKDLFGSLQLVLEPRLPVIKRETSQDTRQFVDASGIVVIDPLILPAANTIVKDGSGIDVKPGNPAFSKELVSFVTSFTEHFNANKPVGANIDYYATPGSLREVELQLKDAAYLVKLRTDTNPLEAAQGLIDTLEFLTNKAQPQEYIDLRISGEAVYQ